jgi:hypothetical protein
MADKKTERGNDFRVVGADAFSMRMNDNTAQIIFGLEVGVKPDEYILENTLVALSPRSLKVLGLIITQAITSFEGVNGPIPLPPGKMEELEKAIKINKPPEKA